MSRSPRVRALVVLAMGMPILLNAPPLPAQEPPPSLRLLATKRTLTLDRFGGRVRLGDLGVWVTPVRGDFELKVARPDFGSPIAVVQRDAVTKAVLRELPADVLAGWAGLRKFVKVIFRNGTGAVVAKRKTRFCPNSWSPQRLDDSGSPVPTYPDACGTEYFPFLRGMVWGIDHGWATAALGGSEWDDFGSPALRVPEGEYQVTVRISRPYADLFQVSRENVRVVLTVTVKNSERRYFYGSSSRTDPSPSRLEGIPTVTDPDPSTLPDLAALPLWGMHVDGRRRGDFLTFAASPWNEGPAPLMVEGFRRADEDIMDAWQYFHDRDGNVVGRAPVGTMEYHRGGGHDHWHFTHLVTFSVLDVEKRETVLSEKQSFCIAPTDAVDLSVESAQYQPYSLRFSSRCGGSRSIWVRTALAAGWADTYYQWVSGQAFNVTDLPNGWYYVRVHVNPLGILYDADPANDIEDRLIFLGGRRGARTLVVSPWHDIMA